MKRMSLEQAKELRGTYFWGFVCKEMDYRISLLIDSLKLCSLETVKEKQIKIAIFEELKMLPQTVVAREEGSVSE